MTQKEKEKILSYTKEYSRYSYIDDNYSFEDCCSTLMQLPINVKTLIDNDVYELIRAREETHLRGLLFDKDKQRGAEFVLKTKFNYIQNKHPDDNISVTINSGVNDLLTDKPKVVRKKK